MTDQRDCFTEPDKAREGYREVSAAARDITAQKRAETQLAEQPGCPQAAWNRVD